MKVYKFGGASVKDASGIKNLTKIIAAESDNLVIVVSDFGKTTNALEKVLKAWLNGEAKYNAGRSGCRTTPRCRCWRCIWKRVPRTCTARSRRGSPPAS